MHKHVVSRAYGFVIASNERRSETHVLLPAVAAAFG